MSEVDDYVQVLYDFCYINEAGVEIKMKKGEELLVIRKSNQDWWQVIRNSEHLPFYAPVCCLSIISNQEDTNFLKNNSNSKDVNANFDRSLTINSEHTSQLGLLSNDVSVNNVSDNCEIEVNFHQQLVHSLPLKESLYSNDSLIVLEELSKKKSDFVEEGNMLGNDTKVTKYYLPLNEDLPPKPSADDIPHRSLPNDWSEFLDNTGRKYYYHSASGKATWKPPRRSETLPNSSNVKQNPFTEIATIPVPKPPPKQLKPKLRKLTYGSTESLDLPTSCMFTILPPGWNQEYDVDTGVVYYSSEFSEKKWYSSQDENGRTYFYDEDGSESFWELPNFSPPSAQELVPTSISHNSKTSLDIGLSAPPSISKPEHFICEDDSPKLHTKRAPKLPVPRQFKTQSMIVPESISVPVTEDEKSSLCSLGCIIMEGTLNKTKLVENGRRVRKNWTTSYVVLTDAFLLFYKDNRSVHPITNSKPEFSIDLNGALIDWCHDKSSRKNVFQISTILGHRLLLQYDDAQEIKDWFWAIQDAIVKLPYSLQYDGVKQDNDDSCKSCIKLNQSKSTKNCHCHKDSDEDINISMPTEKKMKIRDKLRQFFIRRPTIESLREQGIILDEPVFGCHLENLCQKDESVPKFVTKCIGIIEKKELTADGLYRASGNLSQVQKIRFHVNQDDYKCLEEEEDIHVLTGSLKMFFREMKEPLFPFQMFDKFLQAIALPDTQSKMKILKDLVHKMPNANFQTLRFLLQHLLRVTEFHKENRMQVQNLAIVFGPTLMWPEEESANIALDMMHQNRIIEFLLLEFKSIFE